MTPTPLKTYPVAAACYPNGRVRKGFTGLTHVCEVDADGCPVRPLCDRVAPESILADRSLATDEPPTCKSCLRAVKKLDTGASKG